MGWVCRTGSWKRKLTSFSPMLTHETSFSFANSFCWEAGKDMSWRYLYPQLLWRATLTGASQSCSATWETSRSRHVLLKRLLVALLPGTNSFREKQWRKFYSRKELFWTGKVFSSTALCVCNYIANSKWDKVHLAGRFKKKKKRGTITQCYLSEPPFPVRTTI